LEEIGDIDLNPADQLDASGRPIYQFASDKDGIKDFYDRVLGYTYDIENEERDVLNEAFIAEEDEIHRLPPCYLRLNQADRLTIMRKQWYESQDKDKTIARLNRRLKNCRKLWLLERQQVDTLLKIVDDLDVEIDLLKKRLTKKNTPLDI
jgi:hypothetical protein